MDYIEMRPPVSEADIEDLIARLDSVKTSNIDGAVLSNLVRACFELALKKSELIDLSVGDVAKAGGVGNAMQIGGTEVSLPSQAMQVLQDHIDYLKKNGYRMHPTKPLFPTRKKVRYSAKTLDNHLKEA
jgi:site-specific recombinase XerD